MGTQERDSISNHRVSLRSYQSTIVFLSGCLHRHELSLDTCFGERGNHHRWALVVRQSFPFQYCEFDILNIYFCTLAMSEWALKGTMCICAYKHFPFIQQSTRMIRLFLTHDVVVLSAPCAPLVFLLHLPALSSVSSPSNLLGHLNTHTAWSVLNTRLCFAWT